MTGPVIDLDTIAVACRPLAQCLVASSFGRDPDPSELAAALERLTAIRSAPGRIGWAVRRMLDGATIGPQFDGAADVILRAAGYDPARPGGGTADSTPRPTVPPRRRRRRSPTGPPANQPHLPGL